MKKICVIVFILVSVTLSAESSEGLYGMFGNALKEDCQDDGWIGVSCLQYIKGVNDTQAVLAERKDIERLYCIPIGVTGGQMEDVVMKYLYEHPEKLHTSASGLVLNAFIEAFPCEQ